MLQEPKQPAPLPRVSGSFTFKPEQDWQEFVAGLSEFRFRESGRRNWCGPFAGRGDCLAPFCKDGDLTYIDPTLEPRDGDFVLIEWGPRALESSQFQRAAKDWREKYGCDPGPIATKRLRRIGSKWIIAVRNSFYWLDDCKVLGVVVAKERGGLALHAPVANALGPDAVTDAFVLDEPADGSQAYSAVTQPQIESSGIGGLASYTSPANRSTEVKVSWSVQARISNLTSGAAVGESRVRVAVSINGSLAWESIMSIEGYSATNDWATFSGTRDFAVPAGQDIDVNLNSGRAFSTGGASPAQTHFWQNALINLKASKA